MINEVVRKISEAKKQMNNRRDEWQNKTKGVITDALNKAVNEMGVKDINGSIGSSKVYENFEAIQLFFPREPSGIVEKNPNGGIRHFLKINGHIEFAQDISGKIIVVYTSSCIENIGEIPTKEVKDKVEPKDVTEKWVLQHVETFLNEYLNYENEWK